MATKKIPPDRDYRDEPVAWFVLLETSRRSGDKEKAALALEELRRLGYRIEFGLSDAEGRGTGGNWSGVRK